MKEPRLYILMRTDMNSLNPGKGMAQAAHAANMFQKLCGDSANAGGFYAPWFNATEQGFGTTIVVSVPNEPMLTGIVEEAQELGYTAGVVHDPTYPILDGGVVHLLPINTCGFIYVPDPRNVPKRLSALPLHP